MTQKQFYDCPVCGSVLDRTKYPEDQPCPFCEAREAEKAGPDKQYRGSSPRRFEGVVRPRRQNDGAALPFSPTTALQYVRAAVVLFALPVLLFYASPILYSTRVEPVYKKARHVDDYRAQLLALVDQAPIKSGQWADAADTLADLRHRGLLRDVLAPYEEGGRTVTIVAILTGIVGGVAITVIYLLSIRSFTSRNRYNLGALVVLTVVLGANLVLGRLYAARAIDAYEDHRAPIDRLIGLLVYGAMLERDEARAGQHFALGPDRALKDHTGASYLHWAAAGGLDLMTERLIAYGVDLNARDNDGATPLHHAVARGRVSVVTTLLRRGADPALVDNRGQGLLHIASIRPTIAILRLLLEAGLDPNAEDADRVTPLLAATRAGNREAVLLLLDHGAEPDRRIARDLTVFQTALRDTVSYLERLDRFDGEEGGRRVDLIELFIERGASLDAVDPAGDTVLHWTRAALAGLAPEAPGRAPLDRLTRLLVDKGADLSRRNAAGEPAYTLADAVAFNHLDAARQIIQVDPAAVNSPHQSGKMPLQIAIEQGQTDAVRLLLENGADPAQWTGSGDGPLQRAAALGLADVVRLLLEHGPQTGDRDPAAVDAALMLATRAAHVEVVRVLLEHGATNRENDTARADRPLHEAARAGSAEIVALLLEHGANPNQENLRGETALHLAAREGRAEVVRELLRHGADPRSWNRDGKTPLHIAEENNHRDVAAILKGIPTPP